MIGYKPVTITDIKVNPDRTSSVDFVLVEEAIAGEEVTVKAERPRVEVDRTYS